MEIETIVSELGSVVGHEQVQAESAELQAVMTRGEWETRPLAVVSPTDTAQVVELVRYAEKSGIAIVPAGGCTRLHIGYPPSPNKAYFVLSTAKLNKIIDFQPDDLTITCEPGVTLADLQAQLTTQDPPRKLLLALDSPFAKRSTMGGIVSSGGSGFWRSTYGAPRDLLIGLHAVMSEGVSVKGGGRVVKNVAGYDVCKLFTGAWGTLGVLTDLTFRLRTHPEVEQTIAWVFPDLATAFKVGFELHHAHIALTYLLATNEVYGSPMLVVCLHGSRERVKWQVEECARRIREAGVSENYVTLSEEQTTKLLDKQARLQEGTALACRASLLPDTLESVLKGLDSTFAATADCAIGTLSLASSQADIARIHALQNVFPKEANLLWMRLPAALREQEQTAVWGTKRADFFLHRSLKTSLDPHNTFSPERFHGKI